jgi:uncharacterized protein (DUF1501 family)
MVAADVSRRVFLRATASAAALAGAPRCLVAQMTSSSAYTDYRALVSVFLFGGNDSFNMVVPRSLAEYTAYSTSRQNFAIPREALLPINAEDAGGLEYGLHPAMPGLRDLFESGRTALIANVGPLIEPTTKDSFLDRVAAVPPRLFSHSDQQNQWQSLQGVNDPTSGWAGRIADLIRLATTAQQSPTNISLHGATLFQSGDETLPYTMGSEGPVPFYGFGDSGAALEHRLSFERLVDEYHDSIYARAFAQTQRRAIAAADYMTGALAKAPPLATTFPQSLLGQQLQTVARLIAVRNDLAVRRQIFFVGTGGFDTHDGQSSLQPRLLGDLSECLASFHTATVELGVADAVTTFTQSEFGRTLTSNGDGTDHAWGGHQIVIGDSVRGRRMYGTYPSLELDGADDVGGGRIIPTISSGQYAATLAKWFGIAEGDLTHVAPNLTNFQVRDLGFMT